MSVRVGNSYSDFFFSSPCERLRRSRGFFVWSLFFWHSHKDGQLFFHRRHSPSVEPTAPRLRKAERPRYLRLGLTAIPDSFDDLTRSRVERLERVFNKFASSFSAFDRCIIFRFGFPLRNCEIQADTFAKPSSLSAFAPFLVFDSVLRLDLRPRSQGSSFGRVVGVYCSRRAEPRRRFALLKRKNVGIS